MPSLTDEELEERLASAGKSLAQPPAVLDELLALLDVSSLADCVAFISVFNLLYAY